MRHGYPKRFVRRQLHRVIHPQPPRPQRQWTGTATIPYKKGTSEAIRSTLQMVNIRVVFKKGNSLHNKLVHLKDTIPKSKTSNVVYELRCKDCNSIYIGQTMRELNVRVAEHKRRASKPPRNHYDYQRMLKDSAIARHAIDTGHSIDFQNVRIIKQGFTSGQERLYAEAIEIAKAKNSLNRMDGLEIPNTWLSLIGRN